ncbi:MAG: molybdopterin-synthase adenylyltransferase MoeB [Candidatus Omnitrophota bacterium]
MKFTTEQLQRYSRHFILPEIGEEGQKKLLHARVLIVGTGGLGSPVALYLAAAGVGTLGLVDFDTVDLSNLQRQILHTNDSIGTPKLDSAEKRIKAMNPDTKIVKHPVRISSANALGIIENYDIVVDGTDNFPTRYLINDACVLLKKPNVYGSIFRFDGLATVFCTEAGPCYRCLYPDPPPPGMVPSCAEGGVLGILPGVIGVIQATETVKLILGIGRTLVGRLLVYDALQMTFRELKIRRDPAWPVGAAHPTIQGLIDYEQFCGLGRGSEASRGDEAIPEISPDALKEKIDRGDDLLLLDVRENFEVEIGSIQGSLFIPLDQLPARLGELDAYKDKEIVAYCHHGNRSMKALRILRKEGFRDLKNLEDGIDGWSLFVDSSVPRY